MLRTFLLAFSCALAAFTHHNTITEFSSGIYLGEGRLVTTSGHEIDYSTLAALSSDSLRFKIARDGTLFSYDLTFTFGNNGFFTVAAIDNSDGQEASYSGDGYCHSLQCHFTIVLGERIVEETITFHTASEEIYTIGSLRYVDENGDEQLMSWEERFLLISER